MTKRIFASALLLFFAGLTPASAADDWQYWSSATFEHKLDPHWKVFWNTQWRARDDFSDGFNEASRQGVGYQVSKEIDLAAAHSYLEEETPAGKWHPENRYDVQAALKWKWFGLDWSDRQRLEYRHVTAGGKFRYRNQLKISKKSSLGGFEFSPYVSDEVFFDPKRDEWSQNRFSIGVVKKLNENVTLDVYYMLRSDRTGRDFNESNVIGTSFSIVF